MTLLRSACQNPAPPTQSDMAPHHLDLESLILQNCRAFVGSSDAEFDVLTRIDPSEQWYAFVLKTEGGKRTKILENKASRPERAIELLHEASARMVDQYVTCHGYDLPPSTSSKTATGIRGGDLVKPDVIACGSSDSEAFASDSDDSVLPPRRCHRRGHRSGRGAGEATNTRIDRTETQSASDSDEATHRRTPPWGMSVTQRPAIHIPNHPLVWGHPMSLGPAPMPSSIPSGRPVPGMVPPPPGRTIPIPPHPATGKMHAARLNINWPGNGKRNILANVSPTVQCLQQVAINEVVMRPLNSSTPPCHPFSIGRGNNSVPPVRATIRRVTLGEDDTYEMTAFGNDLTALFRSTSNIPKFEIELITANAVSTFPPMLPPRPTSAASSRSSSIAD